MKKLIFVLLVLLSLTGCGTSKKVEDINNYLVEVEINENNISEYFEPLKFTRYNEFGEDDLRIVYGLRSKKYDEGLMVYDIEDSISVELNVDGTTEIIDIESLLACINCMAKGGGVDNFELNFTGRVVGGKIIFIRKEYIKEFEVEEPKNPADIYKQLNMELLNGENIFWHGAINNLY